MSDAWGGPWLIFIPVRLPTKEPETNGCLLWSPAAEAMMAGVQKKLGGDRTMSSWYRMLPACSCFGRASHAHAGPCGLLDVFRV